MDNLNLYQVVFLTFGITFLSFMLLLSNFLDFRKPKSLSEWYLLVISLALAVGPLFWLITELIHRAMPFGDTLLVLFAASYAMVCWARCGKILAQAAEEAALASPWWTRAGRLLTEGPLVAGILVLAVAYHERFNREPDDVPA